MGFKFEDNTPKAKILASSSQIFLQENGKTLILDVERKENKLLANGLGAISICVSKISGCCSLEKENFLSI